LQGFLIPQVLSSHLTANLDRGVRRLLAMWVFVKADLEQALQMLETPAVEGDQGSVDPASMGEQIVELKLFKVQYVRTLQCTALCVCSASIALSIACRMHS
jgi:hypothetical protein